MTIVEHMKDKMKAKMEVYNSEVNGRLRHDGFECCHKYENTFYIDNEVDDVADPEEPNKTAEADDYTPEGYDKYIGALLMVVPRPDGRIQGRIAKQSKDNDGNPIGPRNDNFLLDTRKYEAKQEDGTTEECYANVIAENLFLQVDTEGNQYVLMKEICDHRKLERQIGGTAFRWLGGNEEQAKISEETTQGWQLLVEWKEGGSDWISLKDLKESYPVEVAEYAKANTIAEKPAFAWWVNNVIWRRNRIIAKVKSAKHGLN
jgi:hypothetical protein